MSLRQGVVDALVELVADDPPAAMVDGEVQRRIEDLAHRLSHQGLTLEQYLEATGTGADVLIDGLREEAIASSKADLAIRALIEAESIEADEEAVGEELARIAEQVELPVEEVLDQLERAGRMAAVRSDVQRRKALDWLTERAEVVDPDGNPVDRSLLEPPTPPASTALDSHGHAHDDEGDHTHDD
jgi:trigger factor